MSLKTTNKGNYSKQLHFSILEFFFWASYATYQPFLILYLQNKGLSNISIGSIMSINSLIVIFSPPLWGNISDRIQSHKKIFIILMIMNALIVQTIPFLNSSLMLALALFLLAVFESPLAPLLDSWVINEIRHDENASYGNIRLWGSLSFSIFAFIFGLFASPDSLKYYFFIFGIMVIPIVILAGKTEEGEEVIEDRPKEKPNIALLFKNFSYISFLVFAILLYIPHRASFTFMPNLIMLVGGSTNTQGFASAIMAFSEVPMFLATRRMLRRYKPLHLILASSLFFILRQVIYFYASSPSHVLLAQILHGPSFALFLNGSVYYIDSLAPDNLKSTAQTLATSLYMGLSGVIANFGGGLIIDNLGLKKLYSLGIIIILVGLFLFSISLIKRREAYDEG